MASITVEDGTIVTDANSYVTIAEARSFADDRGITLSVDDAVVSVELILAKDYLEGLRSEYQGVQTNQQVDGTEKQQSLQWPRYGVYMNCSETMFDENSIPVELKNAQMQLCIEQFNGINLFPTYSGKYVIDEMVGPLRTKYSEKLGSSSTVRMIAVENFLNPLFGQCSTGRLRSTRI